MFIMHIKKHLLNNNLYHQLMSIGVVDDFSFECDLSSKSWTYFAKSTGNDGAPSYPE